MDTQTFLSLLFPTIVFLLGGVATIVSARYKRNGSEEIVYHRGDLLLGSSMVIVGLFIGLRLAMELNWIKVPGVIS